MSIAQIVIVIGILIVFIALVAFILNSIPFINKRINNRLLEFITLTLLVSGFLIWLGECLIY